MSSELFSSFFDDPASWTVFASGLSEGHLHAAPGPGGKKAVRLDYDFHGGGGFIAARREILFKLPKTFDLCFSLRGEGPRNNFEFKVVDPGGADTWRHLREDIQLPGAWTEVCSRERDLPFAWGPEGGGAPDLVGAIELVIAAGLGGQGSVWFSDFSLEDLTLYTPGKTTASSHRPNYFPEAVFENGSPSGWHAEATDPAPWWATDFGRVLRFGGLVIGWPPALPPRAFEIDISADGAVWTRIYQASGDSGLRSHIPAACAEARHLRVRFANADSAAMISLSLRPDAFSHTPNDFIHAVAADYPRGFHPRYWHREQSYWTTIGSPEGRKRGLINEEGMVEVDEAGFSLEPFLLAGDKLVTWADVETEVSLPADGIPFPEVTWQADGIKLRVMPWVDGSGDSLVLRTTYQVVADAGQEARLAVAVRPYQVNPPWQAFRNLGGRSPIHRIVCDAAGLSIDGRRVSADRAMEDHGAATFEQGGVLEFLARGEVPPCDSLHDESGLASAVMVWTVPQDTGLFRVTVSVPFFGKAGKLKDEGRQLAIARWQEILAPVVWDAPASAAEALACFRTAACHILINRDGPAIQPGPRRYTRSWVRDCVIMGAALAKANRPEVLREFLSWYAEFQGADGSIPSVVDRDGVDPLVEHDSHGQFLWGVCEVIRYGCGKEFLKTMWPRVRKAAEYLLLLRSQRTTCEYREIGQTAFFGLLPESASHEGYLAHPVHSYWDDFWGIRGLEAAAELALAMGLESEAQRWHEEAAEFLGDVLRSVERVIAVKKLGYIPGSVEWADFDPTATSNAIAQLDFADDLPSGPLYQMFDTYLESFRRKHRGEMPWLNYTAYEIRIIGAFVRIGKREEAHELLEFFLSDRRPLAWNQWPEITWRDPRSPGHLGDVPHTWIAAEYMLALASMVASEREGSEKMVLASGLSWAWISEESGFGVRGLATRYGKLDFHMAASGADGITFQVGTLVSMPHGGLLVEPPLPPGMRVLTATTADGRKLELNDRGTSVSIAELPVTATLRLGVGPMLA